MKILDNIFVKLYLIILLLLLLTAIVGGVISHFEEHISAITLLGYVGLGLLIYTSFWWLLLVPCVYITSKLLELD